MRGWRPTDRDAFAYRIVNARIVFEAPEEGPATALVLHQNGREMRAARSP